MHARLILMALMAVTISPHVLAATPPAARRWTDRSGKFSTEAVFVEIEKDSVVLKKANGSTITVPIARLSDADREYLKTVANPGAARSTTSPRPNLVFPDAVTEPPSWDDGKAPFDLAAYLRPIAAEDNAAPLYLEALYEFEPSEMLDLLYPNLTHDEKKMLWETFRPLRKEHLRLEEAWEKDPKSVNGKDVDVWLSNFDVGFQKLKAAQQRPMCMFQPGRSLHSLWPHVQAPRQVGRVILWRTRRDLERGDLERPLSDIKTLLRLSRDVRVRGGIVAQFVGDALDGRCCELARLVLNAPMINSRQCERLIALFTDHDANMVDPFVEGNRAEYISSRQGLHDLQHRTGSFDPKFMKETWQLTGDTTSPLACVKMFTDLFGVSEQELPRVAARFQAALLPGAWQGGKMLSDEDYAKEVEAVNRFFATILAVAKQSNDWRQQEAAAKEARASISETILARFVVPPVGGVMESIRRNEAHLRGTQCLLALRRWQLEHPNAPPPDLATLVKAAGIPDVPMDPYSDQPLRMALIDGKPAIYSIGSDGKDDQAKIRSNPYTREPGDFIFQLEP